MNLLSTVVDRLAARQPGERDKVGVISLSGGPPAGSWSSIRVEQWLDPFRRLAPVRSGKIKLVELRTSGSIPPAQASGDFPAILNPYGERLPVEKTGGMEAAVQAIGRYVRSGGNWFETGGYPFFGELRPAGVSNRIQVPGEAIPMAGFGRICCGFLKAIDVHAKIRGVAYDQNAYQFATDGGSWSWGPGMES